MIVRDDGEGFDPASSRPGHLGMSTRRDRARVIGARLAIRSRAGAGTTVTLRLPPASPGIPAGRRAGD